MRDIAVKIKGMRDIAVKIKGMKLSNKTKLNCR